MQHKDVFLLEDIIEQCDKIQAIIDACSSDFETFSFTDAYESACAFHIMQIGELSNSLSEQFKETHSEMEWFRIIGLRNRIAHEYGNIDIAALWKTAVEKIPELREYCGKIIK